MPGLLDRFRLDGRVAVVTGGARGLGRVMSEALAEVGASVGITSREASVAESAATEIAGATGTSTCGVGMDVRNGDAVRTAFAAIEARLGPIAILVNNAGINIRAPIEQLSESDWDEVLTTNLKGPWLCCRAAAESLKASGHGRVVNVSSMLGDVGLAERTPYCSSKGGLSQMTRTLALEWAEHGVTVNALCPGPFATEINRPLLSDPEKRAAMESKVPLRRWGDPAEIGPITVYLASDASAFMTGAMLTIDGGFTAQ